MPSHPTVVTYLELDHRPSRAVPPPALPVSIVRARQPPVHFYRYLYETVGGGYVWVERRKLDDEALAAIIQDDGVELYVIHVDGVPAGYGELDFRTPGVADLAYFGLIPEFVGRGIGRYFLDQLISIAWSRAIERMTVNTCTLDHPSALPLYQKAGFEPVARRQTVIDTADARPGRRKKLKN